MTMKAQHKFVMCLSLLCFIIICIIASYEGSPGRKKVPLSRVRLQMQVGNSAEVPHDQAHRYGHYKIQHTLMIILGYFLKKILTVS